MKRHLFALACVCSLLTATAFAQLTPQVAITEMGRGINLGNTLEPPTEGGWNNGPAQEHYFDDYKAVGFSTVRVPIRWDEHTSNSAPYTVNASWMNRVEQIVDWGLERDLYIIINAHHDDWIKQGYSNQNLRDRFDSIWTQVAERFKDKSEKLLFEIINEPKGLTREEVDDLNARVLGIIRQTNPTRLVIYSGNEYSNVNQLLAAAVPDDDYILAYYHSYDPWNFAGLGQGTWGRSGDRLAVRNNFQRVADWSASTGVPVMISEFGAVHGTDFNSRMPFYALYVEEALRHNFAFQVWDDGGMFEVYQRNQRTWHDALDLLIHTFPDGPANFSASVIGDTLISLNWENRTSNNMDIVVQRRLLDGEFEDIATIDKAADTFADTTMAGGFTYQYRIISRFGLGEDRYSYPFEIHIRSTVRSSFLGTPFPIPGIIQAEDFDEGGEGLTYHDADPTNVPGGYRQNVAVDIEPRDDGGFQIAFVESGEWLEYTIDVQQAGTYQLTTHIASLEGRGRFRYSIGENRSTLLTPPRTDSWQTLAPVSTTMELEAGTHILRLEFLVTRPFNVDRFEFSLVSGTSTEKPETTQGFALYPNPTYEYVQFQIEDSSLPKQIEVYNMLGQRVRHAIAADKQRLFVGDLPPGVYLVQLLQDGQSPEHDFMVKK